MRPWEELSSVKVPGGTEEISLHRRGEEYLIKIDGSLLMTNLSHGSEVDLAALGCRDLQSVRRARVLVGGLGMGYTLRAALDRLGPGAEVFVAELVPAVIEWNWGPLAPLAGWPLRDKRVKVLCRDIAQVLKSERAGFHAILQDVDNGPQGQTLKANDWLYGEEGLEVAKRALKPGGVLALWSARPNKPFVKRLRKAGFEVEEHPVRGREGRGAHYIVWLARTKA